MNFSFCKNLREARKTIGFTQKTMAKLLNIAESSYANWELGRTEPSTNDISKLCNILDITSDYLLGLEDEFGNKIQTDPIQKPNPTKLYPKSPMLSPLKVAEPNKLLNKKINYLQDIRNQIAELERQEQRLIESQSSETFKIPIAARSGRDIDVRLTKEQSQELKQQLLDAAKLDTDDDF